jgi:hypothetical protein
MKITALPQEQYTTTKHFDIDGVKYRQDDNDVFYFPAGYTDPSRIICRCGNDRFVLTYGSYEIFAECSVCGAKQSVYSG